MNFLILMIDSLVGFVRRNPVFCMLVLMLAIFAPSVLSGIAEFVLYGILGLVLFFVLLLLFLRWRLARLQREAGKAFRSQGGFGGFGGQGFGSQGAPRGDGAARPEGEVKIHQVSGAAEKRVRGDVGDYVEFEDVKEGK